MPARLITKECVFCWQRIPQNDARSMPQQTERAIDWIHAHGLQMRTRENDYWRYTGKEAVPLSARRTSLPLHSIPRAFCEKTHFLGKRRLVNRERRIATDVSSQPSSPPAPPDTPGATASAIPQEAILIEDLVPPMTEREERRQRRDDDKVRKKDCTPCSCCFRVGKKTNL